MPSGNMMISEKLQFVDERDGFISWLRGEFAAANAIIDSLCHHLRTTGEPNEYDVVLSSIQQRRCNWHPVLHMQQYFSVSEVLFALQQVAWSKQQRHLDQKKSLGGCYYNSSSWRPNVRGEANNFSPQSGNVGMRKGDEKQGRGVVESSDESGSTLTIEEKQQGGNSS
ncbi:hypothetical protein GIB67_008834 [Kingdonia uniflora]|uniref:Uncharacterized protein n=1 Tax=Kingdonia uniflora TaxID=39325 RepID=A0A7J7LVG0_9MAGN|nr:hypothetical protein GIB67_008834 [Kingdonia uniflora]